MCIESVYLDCSFHIYVWLKFVLCCKVYLACTKHIYSSILEVVLARPHSNSLLLHLCHCTTALPVNRRTLVWRERENNTKRDAAV